MKSLIAACCDSPPLETNEGPMMMTQTERDHRDLQIERDEEVGTAENDLTVTVSVKERDGQTLATARLRSGKNESVGVGLSRLSPSEHGVGGIGRELAVARALSDLARRMMSASARDMEAVTARPTTTRC